MEQYLSLWPTFLEGFRVTLLLLAVSGVLALVLGTLIAAMRISPVGALRTFAAFWTEIARNTPLTLVFIFTTFVMPMLGVRMPFILLAFIALTYYTSPFIAEALRSGINGVPVGQAEAARSIGLGFGQTVSLVVLPQAFRMTIPPLINVFIALTKNTSVAGGFFVLELFGDDPSARERQREHRHPDPPHRCCPLSRHHDSARAPRRGARETLRGAAMSGSSVLFDAPGPRARRLSLILSIVSGVSDPRRPGLGDHDAGGAARIGRDHPSRHVRSAAGGISSPIPIVWGVLGRGVVATLQAAAVAAVGAIALGIVLLAAAELAHRVDSRAHQRW